MSSLGSLGKTFGGFNSDLTFNAPIKCYPSKVFPVLQSCVKRASCDRDPNARRVSDVYPDENNIVNVALSSLHNATKPNRKGVAMIKLKKHVNNLVVNVPHESKEDQRTEYTSLSNTRYDRLRVRDTSIHCYKLLSVNKEGFNPIIDIAANAYVQRLCKHNIEVNLVKYFGVVQVDDISISTSLEDVKQVVEMVKKLTKTRPPSAKVMLIWVEKIVVLEVCNEVSLNNFF